MAESQRIPGVLRPMVEADVAAYAAMLKRSFNTWYRSHGWGRDRFRCDERELVVYWEIYSRISPGGSVVALHPDTAEIMGACFYHPRAHHVSLGIMSVAPEWFGRGVGAQLLRYIIDFADAHEYPALRLVGSAMNVDSFSLYNRAGLVPRVAYQDMLVAVPEQGLAARCELDARVRDADEGDVEAVAELERKISGVCRPGDYRFCIQNPVGCLHASVVEDGAGRVAGFAASIRHPAARIVGPAFSHTEEQMFALLLRELDRFRGEAALLIIPMDKRALVEALYRLGAVNVETHLFQVRGRFQPFDGVNLPSFLPETG